jgi:hypothetical protein
MKLKKFILILILTGMFFSCKKENQLIISKPASKPLLERVISSDQAYLEYSYNAARLIKSEITKYQFTLFNYNSNNQLISTDYYWDVGILNKSLLVLDTVLNRIELANPLKTVKSGSITFDYDNNGRLIKSTFIHESGSPSEYSVFTYNQDNRISRQTLYWANNISGFIDYSYDAQGNVIKEILYHVPATGSAVLSSATEYEYDDKPNPFKWMNRLMTPGVYTNQNNITKETCTIYSGADQKTTNVQITQNVYEYNSYGFPDKKNGTIKYLYE